MPPARPGRAPRELLGSSVFSGTARGGRRMGGLPAADRRSLVRTPAQAWPPSFMAVKRGAWKKAFVYRRLQELLISQKRSLSFVVSSTH